MNTAHITPCRFCTSLRRAAVMLAPGVCVNCDCLPCPKCRKPVTDPHARRTPCCDADFRIDRKQP